MISREHFDAWLQDPMTQELMKLLETKREELRQQWEGGTFTDYEKDGTILVNVGNLGTCKGYAFVSEMTYDKLATELEYDEQPERTGASRRGGPDQAV